MRASLRVAAVAAAVACASAPARADRSGTYVSDPSNPDDVEPLYVAEYRAEATFAVGFDVGLGAIGSTCGTCEQTLGGLALVAYGGAMVTRRIAALIDLQSVLHLLPADTADRGLLSNTLATASGRLWVTPTFWLQTGAGLGVLNVAGGGSDSGTELGPGFAFAVGGEVDHHPDRGIDLAARFGLGLYDDDEGDTFAVYNISATVGWHWY